MSTPTPHTTRIIVAANGARHSKDHHPNLPITAQEMAIEAQQCVAAGASMIHLHARDANGVHSLAVEENREVYQMVKQAVGDQALVQLTTEAVGRYSPEQQMALVDTLQPEATSLALAELIPSPESEPLAAAFFQRLAKQNTLVQYIIYTPEQMREYGALRQRGTIPDSPHHLLIVLGRYQQQQQSHPQDLDAFMPLLSDIAVPWAVCAFGAQEQACLCYAASLGADVRVGFENNLFDEHGQLAASNASQVASLKRALAQRGIEVVTHPTWP